MKKWVEFRLWYDGEPPNPDRKFEFKKKHLLPILEEPNYRIDGYMILDEDKYKFMLMRLKVDYDSRLAILERLQSLASPLFSKVTVEDWDPVDDARQRILSVKKKAEKEGEAGKKWLAEVKWLADEQDLSQFKNSPIGGPLR